MDYKFIYEASFLSQSVRRFYSKFNCKANVKYNWNCIKVLRSNQKLGLKDQSSLVYIRDLFSNAYREKM